MLHLKKSVYCNLNDIRSLWLLQRRKAAMKTPSQDAINLQIFVSLTWARGQFACEQFGSNAFMNFLTLHWYCRSKTDSLFLVYEFLSPFNFWKHEPSESLENTKSTFELEFFFMLRITDRSRFTCVVLQRRLKESSGTLWICLLEQKNPN